MTIVNVSMEKCRDYFNPPKPEEKYQESRLLAFTLQKFCIFSKNEKKYKEIICVKHLTANKYYWH